jgi:hypothetical protein
VNVSTPAAVYISPQFINPLVAGSSPIALTLAARPDLAEAAGSEATRQAAAAESRQQKHPADEAATGSAGEGRVDVYA